MCTYASLLAAGLLLALGQPIAAQTPQAPPSTGTITGHLTTGDVGLPLRKAQVRLMAGPKTVRTTTTDVDGRYALLDVPAGEYTLVASRPGFLDMVRGARQPGPTRQGTVVRVAAGQTLEDISWTLPRAGVITGVVLDEFGDPAFNVPVRALRLGTQNGFRALVGGAGNATTDDRGIYRIAGLMPGEYLVAAVPRDTVSAAAMQAEALRDRQAQILAASKARGAPPPAGMMLTPPPMPSRVGYVPVYFPGTALGASAATVRVGASEEVSGIDIRLEVIETVTVSGRLVSGEGGVIPTSRLQLIDASMPLNQVGIWFRDAREDGSFDFHGVVPGSYLVKAAGTPGGQKGMAGGEMWGRSEVAVGRDGADNVLLTMQRGVTVSVGLAAGTLPPGLDRSKLRVSLYPISSPTDWEMPIVTLAPGPDGRLVAANILPGTFRFQITGLPDDWSLGTAVVGGTDAADHHLTIDGSRNLTGELSFTSRTAELAGALTNSSGAPVTDHALLLFPADRDLWLPQSRRIQVVPPGPDGRYRFRNLAPGDYRLAAVFDLEPGQQFDREFLSQLSTLSTAVSLGEGEGRTQDLVVK